MKRSYLLFCLLSFFYACSNPPYQGYQAGVSDFVMDSYKIKEGKFSILEMEGFLNDTLPSELLVEKEDLIQNGDVLNVHLYHPTREDISKSVDIIGAKVGFIVTNGEIFLPELTSVKIEGLTLIKAKQLLETIYRKEIQEVEVFLSFKERKEKKVELIGEVVNSSVVIDGKTRLFDVLSKAKISFQANLFKSYVIRDQTLLPVDINRLIREGDMSQNIVMEPRDKIFIAEASSSSVMMLGEINHQGLISLPSGSISLREALAKAGGIPYTGDKAYIQILRGNIIKPKIYTVNWKHIVQLPTSSMLLIPGDIVYVAATPITEWNRFVSQLFPSFTTIDWFGKGAAAIAL